MSYKGCTLIYSGYQQHATYRLQNIRMKLRFSGRQSKRKAVKIISDSDRISSKQS